jgi:hypothetical protein
MKDLISVLVRSAAAFDRKGLFAQADAVDDVLGKFAAGQNGGALVAQIRSDLASVSATDTGSRVALEQAKRGLDGLSAVLTSSFQNKTGGAAVRLGAKEFLKSFLALNRGEHQAALDMFEPVLKPIIDSAQALSIMPDELMFGA